MSGGRAGGETSGARRGRALTSPWLPLLLVAAYVACATGTEVIDDDPPPWDVLCPRPDSDCTGAAGPLLAGAAVRDITPTVTETFLDCGVDNLCPQDAGWTAPDTGENNAEFDGYWANPDGVERFDDADEDGIFDAVWIAGFGNARAAHGVHDPVWARAVVLRRGDTTLALVALDLIGYFYDEVQRIRAELPAALGVDLLMVSATHTHQGPDAIGIWGYDEGTTGTNPEYMAFVRQQVVAAVTEAVGALEDAEAVSAHGPAGWHPDPAIAAAHGINNLVMDGRDPVVLDETLRVLQLRRAADDGVIATVINWANHPEAACSRNRYISSDFAHYLRLAVEQGVQRAGVNEPGAGGVAVYINGAVGGMQTPLDVDPVYDLDGTALPRNCDTTQSVDAPVFDRVRAIGELVGLDALRMLRDQGTQLSDPDLSFVTRRFQVPIDNNGYHAMFLGGVFYGACEYDRFGTVVPRRCIYAFDESQRITDDNLPSLETEVAVLNLGDIQMITIPGELLPELFHGGYDGSHVGPRQQLIDSWYNQEHGVAATCLDDAACGYGGDSECQGLEVAPGRVCSAGNCCCVAGQCRSRDYNPPDVAAGPAGPYLEDHMTRPVHWVLGLTPDELGYIIPTYDYQLDEQLAYIEEAPGDHYEETNSVSPTISGLVQENLELLLELSP